MAEYRRYETDMLIVICRRGRGGGYRRYKTDMLKRRRRRGVDIVVVRQIC